MAMKFSGKAKLIFDGHEIEVEHIQIANIHCDAVCEVIELQSKADALGDACCRELGEIERRCGR